MQIINDISNFIFIKDEPEKSDIIFIAGGSNAEPPERAAELWLNGFAPLVLPSGKYGFNKDKFSGVQSKKELYQGEYETEWDFMKDILVRAGVDESAILLENCARHTRDNAFMSRTVTDSLGLTIQKAIICCKSFDARRCMMTYSWAYPDTKFLICPVDSRNICKDNWFNNERGIEMVMSELQKCGQYFKEAISLFIDKQ